VDRHTWSVTSQLVAVVRISDISGEVLHADSGARVVVTYLDGRPSVELDVSDHEARVLLDQRTAPAKAKGSTIEEKRKHHPRAYERWSPEEEAQLRQLHEQGLEPKEMAAELGRQLGGVRSRLIKLGLIDDL